MAILRLLSIFITVALLGCWSKEVNRTLLGESVVRKKVNCSHAGYCYGCGVGFNGKFNCSFKWQYTCSGQQEGDVIIQYWVVRYEDGSEVNRSTERVIRRYGVCQ